MNFIKWVDNSLYAKYCTRYQVVAPYHQVIGVKLQG